MSAVMSNTGLPTTITQLLPTLQALNVEQKLLLIKALLSDRTPNQAKADDTLEYTENLAWETGKNLFGSYSSGRQDLSANAKTLVKSKIRQKYGKDSH